NLDTKGVRIEPGSARTTYYQVSTAGFDRPATATAQVPAASNGIDIKREFLGEEGKLIALTPQGSTPAVTVGRELYVRIVARSTAGNNIWLDNVAIVDLLPAGFEVVTESIRGTGEESDTYVTTAIPVPAPATPPNAKPGTPAHPAPPAPDPLTPEYVDIREDRVVLYGGLGNSVRTYVYKIRATNSGTFSVPHIHAEAMYDKAINASSSGGTILRIGAPAPAK
ncbi:MAG: hypothetical protein ACAI35_08290, partial [Candidatus Methylacidiphilales bacterium]